MFPQLPLVAIVLLPFRLVRLKGRKVAQVEATLNLFLLVSVWLWFSY